MEKGADKAEPEPKDQQRQGGASRRGGSSRKKYPDMNQEELGEAKARLQRMAGSMGNWMSGEQLDAAVQKINAIVAAIDANELDKAQQLSDAMVKAMRSGRGGGSGGRPGGGGRRGGE